MEANTNVSMAAAPAGDNLEINLDAIVQLVKTLYASRDPAEQAEANKRLTELQSSNEAWTICWTLLNPDKCLPPEVSFFAANTLVLKINNCWSQQSEEWLRDQLRPKLFETLLKYASAPNADKLVIERLSLALAVFALHSIPNFWPNALEDIMLSFNSQTITASIAPQKIYEILLKIFAYLPEEYSVSVPKQDERAKLNAQMTNSGPIVIKFLHSLLVADNSAVSLSCKQSVLKCLTSWLLHSQTSLLEIDDGRVLINLLYDAVMDDELCSQSCAALAATFSSQKAEKFSNTVIDFIPRIASLKMALEKYISEDDIECTITVYSLITNFSENHSRLFLRVVLADRIQLDDEKMEITKQAIFNIIKVILDCTSAPGTYGVDEKYSDMSFSFWFTFFENFYYYADTFNDLICKTFDPLVDSLLQIFIQKSQYPSTTIYYQTWNDDQREAYRCYRQDVGDNLSLLIHFPRSRDRILSTLLDGLTQELSKVLQSKPDADGSNWQGLESVVFALKSVAEPVPYDEAKYIPKVFALLSQVPFSKTNALLYCTVAEMISAFSDWFFTHDNHLAIAFNILFLGIDSADSQVRLMSTLSLKDITSECQAVLKPYATEIVNACTTEILKPYSRLTSHEKSRVMHTIGTTLAIAPKDFVARSLDTICSPLLHDLTQRSHSDTTNDPTSRLIILEKLNMLNSLIESLHIKESYACDYDVNDENIDVRNINPSEGEFMQPSLELLRRLVPLLTTISCLYRHDEEIMGAISNAIKRSAKSLGSEIKPIIGDFLNLIVEAYDPRFNSDVLDGSLPLYLLFKNDRSLSHCLVESFARISNKTLEACIGGPLQQMSQSIENYFKYASTLCKKSSEFLCHQSSTMNQEFVYKLAIAALELPEKRTLAEVCSFLVQFRNQSRGVDHLNATFVGHLSPLLSNIFNILGGNYSTPRNAIDPVSDLLFATIDAKEARPILNEIVEKDGFPTEFVDREKKSRFVSKILQEKNRRKFKDACNEFVLLVRNLNRML